MSRTISDVVREVCLGLPETTERISHGSPDYCVAGKTFATYVINHHGDGRVALWLNSPDGAQQLYADMEPEHYFVPPYVGPKGWLGVNLDTGLTWKRVAELVQDAWANRAPARLAPLPLPAPATIAPPDTPLDPLLVAPFTTKAAAAILKPLRHFCLDLPEVVEATQFGDPVWRAGKKSFCSFHVTRQHNLAGAANLTKRKASNKTAGKSPDPSLRFALSFWTGVDRQDALTMDHRFVVPHYTGHNGWILLDVHDSFDLTEVEPFIIESYRHFALKRMLNALDL